MQTVLMTLRKGERGEKTYSEAKTNEIKLKNFVIVIFAWCATDRLIDFQYNFALTTYKIHKLCIVCNVEKKKEADQK